jgi:nuclear transport factor 2 (NTF2) superfamily protein
MLEIKRRIENLVAVINQALSGFEAGTNEIIEFLDGKWYREHVTELKTLIWAYNSIIGADVVSIIYDSKEINVEGLI